jgi:hypothetical protein
VGLLEAVALALPFWDGRSKSLLWIILHPDRCAPFQLARVFISNAQLQYTRYGAVFPDNAHTSAHSSPQNLLALHLIYHEKLKKPVLEFLQQSPFLSAVCIAATILWWVK